jgi:hypothetical protein
MKITRALSDFRWAVRLSFVFFRFQWSIRATFKSGIIILFVNSVLGLLSWFFIGNMFASLSSLLRKLLPHGECGVVRKL